MLYKSLTSHLQLFQTEIAGKSKEQQKIKTQKDFILYFQ